MVKKYPIIVSIKHEYCELIYKGFKALELRKTRPENDEFLAYIYDTSLKHITGLMDISGIQEITEINDTLCKNACVSPDFARQYKEQGKGKLYAWNIESASFYDEDWLTLKNVHVPRAPQSWQYLPHDSACLLSANESFTELKTYRKPNPPKSEDLKEIKQKLPLMEIQPCFKE